MPRIVLLNPFIRHYAGSIFDLSDELGIRGWDDDIRVTDRMSLIDARYYVLPDAGNGRSAELSVEYAARCPEYIFEGINLKSGPCRITSTGKSLEDPIFDNRKECDGIAGKGCVRLKDAGIYKKNELSLNLNETSFPIQVNCLTNPDRQLVENYTLFSKSNFIDLSSLHPGFYFFELKCNNAMMHNFTLIKCYPLVVTFHTYPNKCTTQDTIW